MVWARPNEREAGALAVSAKTRTDALCFGLCNSEAIASSPAKQLAFGASRSLSESWSFGANN
jgi:hypothetical protein